MKEVLKDIFNRIYLRVYGDEYVFSNARVEKCLDEFLTIIPSSAGEDWLYNYTVFQFAYYSNKRMRFDRVYLNWIYGEKALKRWMNKTEAQVFYADKYKVNIGVRKPQDSLSAHEYRDAERWRFKDINRQLIHCDETSLFEVKSDVCRACPMYKTCLLKDRS